MSGPDKIWLDPECNIDADYEIDRCWHSKKPDACDDCGMEPVEYIRADRTPDPAQIRADALREAMAAVRRNSWIHQGADAYSQGMDAGARLQNKLDYDAILALLATPLSPTAVDGSIAPDAGSKDGV